MASRVRRNWLMCLILLPVAGFVLAAEEPVKLPKVPVAKPVAREVTDHEDYTGVTEPSKQVNLRARVTGYLTATQFKEGGLVKEGDVLFEIDPRPYQALVDQALGQVKVNKAALQLARTTLGRDQTAAKAVPGSISQQQLDLDQSEVDVALARIDVSEAMAQSAKLNLLFCKVTAPISGRIGSLKIDPGNLVVQNETLLANLIVQDPMYVYFDIDEGTYLRLRRLKLDGMGGADKLPVDIGLFGEEKFSQHGILDDATASSVDPGTGTVRMRSTLANKDGLLLPSMYVHVRLALGPPRKALLVSDRAIGSDQGLKYVYVLDAANKVQYRRVTLGQLQPDGLRAITQGLKPEDRVVTGRLAELRPGVTVQPEEIDMPAPKGTQPPKEPPSARGQADSGIIVEANYPGASAQVVSDAVRIPIEAEVSGLENIRYMRSRCTSDGKYALDVNFAPGVDSWRTQVQVQNRVTLALVQLPATVQNAGLTVKRGTSGALLVVNLFSPDGRYDRLYLGNYASIQIKDELSRLSGVSEVALLGSSDFGMRIWLDPGRLASRNLTAVDVDRALRKEKRDGDLGPEKVADLLVKADTQGQAVRLRDVASIELGVGLTPGEAFLDGRPTAALVVYLNGDVTPGKVRTAVREKLNEIRKRMPNGLNLDITFDFTANLQTPEGAGNPEYLLLDLDVPADSATDTAELLQRTEALARQIPGVQHVLAFSANPFDLFGGRPCLLVLLNPAGPRKTSREEIIKTIRTRLGSVEEVTIRVRDLSAAGCLPRCGYPLDMALYGPDADRVRWWASELARRLERSKKLTDVWANPDSVPRPTRIVDINRGIAAIREVALEDVFNSVDLYTGAMPVHHMNAFGRTWGIELKTQARSGDWATDLVKLKIRNAKGQMVSLSSFVKVREVEMPLALDFFNLLPMVEITANPGPGVSPSAGQKLCAELAEEVRKELGLSADYRLNWLQRVPRAKID